VESYLFVMDFLFYHSAHSDVSVIPAINSVNHKMCKYLRFVMTVAETISCNSRFKFCEFYSI
jgi:hypothetical protein